MDARVRAMIRTMVTELAETCARELAAAGTLVDLEELTVAIGDEVARQLCEKELQNRAERASQLEECECPVCHRMCLRKELEPAVLQGVRGEIVFSHPGYFCRHCRRSFFPSTGAIGAGSAGHGDAGIDGEDDLGGEQPGEL